ncbi:GatB/YqeY domain-containing protein [Candidatus Collierbacteria bacterium]|nr:GatB/YqeY domain-containing protein [Candidatus Collierbacteria bacterium]
MAGSLFDRIKEDMVSAQKARDARLLDVLRMMSSELSYKVIEVKGGLNDEQVIEVLRREAKKRQESIDIYEKVGDKARTEAEKYELEVIEKYLPKMMADEELEAEIDKIAAASPNRGGMLIGEVKRMLGGKASGATIAKIVNQKYAV